MSSTKAAITPTGGSPYGKLNHGMLSMLCATTRRSRHRVVRPGYTRSAGKLSRGALPQIQGEHLRIEFDRRASQPRRRPLRRAKRQSWGRLFSSETVSGGRPKMD